MNKIQTEEFKVLIELDRICRKHDIKYFLSFGTLLGAIRHDGFIPWDDDIDVCMLRDEYNRFLEIVNNEIGHDYFFQDYDNDIDYFHAFGKLRSNRLELKEKSTENLRAHNGVWVDIFPLDQIPNELVARNEQRDKIYKYNKLISLMVYTFVTEEDQGLKKVIKSVSSSLSKITYRYNPLLKALYKKRLYWITKYNCLTTENVNLLSENFSLDSYKGATMKLSNLNLFIEHKFEDGNFYIPKEFDEILTGMYGDYMTLPPIDEQVSNHYIID